MPNHFHLLIRENTEGGISKFMGKLLTAYSMYFNKKNERSGPLFTRPFRAVHVARDEHLNHLFSYIHLNCVDLIDKDWKIHGIQDMNKAEKYLLEYPYSSYKEFLNPDMKKIVDQQLIDEVITRAPLVIQEFEEWYTLFGDENAKLEK